MTRSSSGNSVEAVVGGLVISKVSSSAGELGQGRTSSPNVSIHLVLSEGHIAGPVFDHVQIYLFLIMELENGLKVSSAVLEMRDKQQQVKQFQIALLLAINFGAHQHQEKKSVLYFSLHSLLSQKQNSFAARPQRNCLQDQGNGLKVIQYLTLFEYLVPN